MDDRNARRLPRRDLLAGAGAVVAVLAAGGLWRAEDQGVWSTGHGPAYDPWRTWRDGPGLFALVGAGVLAANPHDSQPWLFHLGPSTVDLFADHRRNLGAVDPLLREMHIGLGCALENAVLAAAAKGYRATVQLMPDPTDPTLVGRLDLERASAHSSALYQAIPHRHTNRFPFASRSVSAGLLNRLTALNDDEAVGTVWFTTPPDRRRVVELMVAAARALVADPQQSDDSSRWFRGTWQAVQEHRDGLTLDAQGLSPAVGALAKMLPEQSRQQQDAFFVQGVQSQAGSAPALGLLVVRDSHNNAQRLRAGRLWQRMHLWAITQGLAMQPLNQMCERADREASLGIEPRFGSALRGLVSDRDWEPLMPFRIGYPTHDAHLAPRRPVVSVMV